MVVTTAKAVNGIAISCESIPSSAPCAAPALAMNDEVVTTHRVLQIPGQALELLLQPLVLKRGYPTAAIADGVMVVLAARDDRLEPGAPASELDSLHKPHVVE
jgi:hypothetical protein